MRGGRQGGGGGAKGRRVGEGRTGTGSEGSG